MRIVTLPGDGIGAEVMTSGLDVLEVLEDVFELDVEIRSFRSGWKYFSEEGRLLEEGAKEACHSWCDVILHGATGWPGVRPRDWSPADGSVVLDLRHELDLFANIRPVRLMEGVPVMVGGRPVDLFDPADVDITIVRENVEGLYFGARNRPFPSHDTEIAIDERPITRGGAARLIDRAFRLALDPGAIHGRLRSGEERDAGRGKRLTCVDKSNVLPGCALFRNVFDRLSMNYPSVETDRIYVDAFQLALLQDPAGFDVVVTTNLMGDMISDLASLLQGGLGMAPSANVGTEKALFEPVHGSAPDITGQGIANPTGMILSIKMMLDWMNGDNGVEDASKALEGAVRRHFSETDIFTPDLGGEASTSEITSSIISFLK